MPRRRNHIPTYRLHKQSGQAVVTPLTGIGGVRLAGADAAPALTVNELILAYYRHVEANCRGSGDGPGRNLDNIKNALRPLRELYGDTLAATFGPKALKTVQQKMVEAGLCRNTVNRRIGRIKTMIRWVSRKNCSRPRPGTPWRRCAAWRGGTPPPAKMPRFAR